MTTNNQPLTPVMREMVEKQRKLVIDKFGDNWKFEELNNLLIEAMVAVKKEVTGKNETKCLCGKVIGRVRIVTCDYHLKNIEPKKRQGKWGTAIPQLEK